MATTSKNTETKKPEAKKEAKASPLKREVRTVLAMEVDGVEYTGEVAVDEKLLGELDEIATEWDEAQQKYAELTQKLVFKMEEVGLEAEKPKRTGSDAKKVRRWARRVGVDVNPQGAIPGEVREKYESAKTRGELEADEK